MMHLKISKTLLSVIAVIFFLSFLLPTGALAKVFCVSTEAELQAALKEAESNGQDDIIKVEQGLYVGNFKYSNLKENFSLTIEGGYTPGCTERIFNPSNTILRGARLDKYGLSISSNADFIKVEGFTIANSKGLVVFLEKGSINVNNNIIEETNGMEVLIGDEGNITINDNEFLKNSSSGDGGAIDAIINREGTITIKGNTFNGNTATRNGGAIFANTKKEGSITITGNIFVGNTAKKENGGAVSASTGLEGNIVISGNTFEKNKAGENGGGFDAFAPSGKIGIGGNKIEGNEAGGDGGGGRTRSREGTILYDKNNISGNTAGGNGGGADAFSDEGVQRFIENLFEGNKAGGNGGGLNSDDTDEESKEPNKKDKTTKEVGSLGNKFFNNSAAGRGGGAHFEFTFVGDEPDPVIDISGDQYTGNTAFMGAGLAVTLGTGSIHVTNGAFTSNFSEVYGGGAFFDTVNAHTRILHSTATGNDADGAGAGGGFAFMLFDDQNRVEVLNTIAFGNNANSGADLYFNDDADGNNSGAYVTLDTNIIADVMSICEVTTGCIPDIEEVNTLNVDPKVDTDGFHLLFSSPATDTANQVFVISTDIDGDTRPFGAVSDIGADEFTGGSTNIPPVADANGPYTVETEGIFALNGTGSFDPDPGDIIVSYEWDLDNDGTFDVSGSVLTIPPALRESFGINTVGTYPITLQVTDNHGATDTDTTMLDVIPPAGTIAVTNINDSGTGSLREAINSANANLGDTIIFSISGTPPFTITSLSPLPEITDPVAVDGTTQPGFVDTPVIVIDGSNAGAGADGLVISAGDSTVRGLNIHSFDGNGITLSNSIGNNVIDSSFIGTDSTGNLDLGNGQDGVNIISSPGNRVLNSVISGNDANGIRIVNVTDPVNPTIIQGNNIGVTAGGTAPLGNTFEGLRIENSLNNLIGGTAPGEGNIIGANSDGASIIGSTGIIIQGNQWGDNINIGNLGAALGFAGGSSNNIVEGNIFAYNGFGVIVFPGSTGIEITNNSFHDHSGLAIDLGFDGVTPNDPLDLDTGANSLQNFPEILVAGTSSVLGEFSSMPNTSFRLEFFSSTSCNTSGFGEGETFLGSLNIVTGGSGVTTFSTSFAQTVPVGHFITATAKNTDGTSEFSQCRVVE